MGHHRPQEPRADLQPCSHRLYRRRVCRWAGIRSPQPLHLAGRHPAEKPISRADVFVRPEIVSFSERFNNRTAIDRALKQAQADVQYVAAAKAFDKGDFGTFLDEFFKAIHSRYDIEKPNVQRLIRRKLNIINRLKEENRALKQAALEKEKALVKYAREYILMGDECLKHDMKEAAMKNYEKAVTLCPKFKEAWKKIKKLEKEMLKR